MKLSDIILEGVTPAESGKATEELLDMLKQHGKAVLPTGQQVTMEGLARVALRTSIDSYLQRMGDRVTGIEGVELDVRGVPAIKFKETGDSDAAMRQYIDQERQKGRSID